MQWAAKWRALWGRALAPDHIRDIEQWLDEQFDRKWTNEQVSEALDAIAEHDRSNGRKGYPPDSPRIKSAIIKARYLASQGQAGAGADDFPAIVRRAMMRAPDHMRRWEILCEPQKNGLERETTIQECQGIDRWAERRWDDWRATIDAMKTRMAHELHAALHGIFGGPNDELREAAKGGGE